MVSARSAATPSDPRDSRDAEDLHDKPPPPASRRPSDTALAVLGVCAGVVLSAVALLAVPARFKVKTVCAKK